MTRSVRKTPIQKSKPKSVRRIRRSFQHALRAATNRAIANREEIMPVMKEVSDAYSISDSTQNGYRQSDEDRRKIKRK